MCVKLGRVGEMVPIHTLAKQMGTSVLMIERHYSHLKVIQAVEQLSGVENRRKIAAVSTVEDIYKSAQDKKVEKNIKGRRKP